MGPKSRKQIASAENSAKMKRNSNDESVDSPSAQLSSPLPFEVEPFDISDESVNIESVSADNDLNKGCQTDDLEYYSKLYLAQNHPLLSRLTRISNISIL